MAQPVEHRSILLIGGTGQVGWELRRTLATLAEVVAPDRHAIDLADCDSLRRAIENASPCLIVNAAAYTAVDKAERDEETASAINATAPGVMAEEARRRGIPLVHYSTDYVFDGTGNAHVGGEPRPYREDDTTAPLNAYGRSKLAGEKAIQAVDPMHLILRTSWVYSQRGTNFLRTIQRLAAERDELRIVADQIGSPTWARMLAEATSQMLVTARNERTTGFRLSSGELGGLFHMSAAGSTSWYGFAKAIVDATAARDRGRPVKVTPISTAEYPVPAKRPAYSVLDNNRLRSVYGIALPDWGTQLGMSVAG